MAVSLGFQRTEQPIMAGVPARLPPMAVKLKGAMAATNPSKPRRNIVFTDSEVSIGLYFSASMAN